MIATVATGLAAVFQAGATLVFAYGIMNRVEESGDELVKVHRPEHDEVRELAKKEAKYVEKYGEVSDWRQLGTRAQATLLGTVALFLLSGFIIALDTMASEKMCFRKFSLTDKITDSYDLGGLNGSAFNVVLAPMGWLALSLVAIAIVLHIGFGKWLAARAASSLSRDPEAAEGPSRLDSLGYIKCEGTNGGPKPAGSPAVVASAAAPPQTALGKSISADRGRVSEGEEAQTWSDRAQTELGPVGGGAQTWSSTPAGQTASVAMPERYLTPAGQTASVAMPDRYLNRGLTGPSTTSCLAGLTGGTPLGRGTTAELSAAAGQKDGRDRQASEERGARGSGPKEREGPTAAPEGPTDGGPERRERREKRERRGESGPPARSPRGPAPASGGREEPEDSRDKRERKQRREATSPEDAARRRRDARGAREANVQRSARSDEESRDAARR